MLGEDIMSALDPPHQLDRIKERARAGKMIAVIAARVG